MSSPFKTKEFKSLFKKWNKILEKDGLKEIEDFDRPVPVLKAWHNLKWKTRESQRRIPESQCYYEAAQALLHTHVFKNRTHERIWEMHCNGLSLRQIAKELRKKKFKKSMIHEIILEIQTTTRLKRE